MEVRPTADEDRQAPARRGRLARWALSLLGWSSPILLVLTLLAFVLPFASVSCATPAGFGSAGGGVAAKYSGLTLAFGGEPSLEPADRPLPAQATRDEDRAPGQPGMVAALALTAGALLASLRLRQHRFLVTAVLALLAGLLTIWAYDQFDRSWTGRIVAKLMVTDPEALVRAKQADFVQPDRGYGTMLVLLGLTVLLNAGQALVRWFRRPSRRASPP